MGIKKQTEKDFTAQVIALAQLRGWRVMHVRPGLTRSGRWVTAVQGDGVGFPDLLMIRGDTLLVAELKVGKNKTTPAQDDWLDAFGGCGAKRFVWTPEQWEEIESTLK